MRYIINFNTHYIQYQNSLLTIRFRLFYFLFCFQMRLYIIRRSICTNLLRPCQITPVPSVIKKATKDKSYDEISDGFVDWVRVQIKAGDGGNGGNTLLSTYCNEFAGPDGGNGGNGGHFLFKASKKINSLGHLKVKMNNAFAN